MNKLITLALLAAISTLGTAQLSAQVSDGPCYDLRAFCNYDGNCENYWMPLLYITCNGAQGNWNAYAERYEIASPDTEYLLERAPHRLDPERIMVRVYGVAE